MLHLVTVSSLLLQIRAEARAEETISETLSSSDEDHETMRGEEMAEDEGEG